MDHSKERNLKPEINNIWREPGEESYYNGNKLSKPDYSEIIGRTVRGTIDRPMGSKHPEHPDLLYEVNYGYVDGIYAADGEEQDVYYIGVNEPVSTFTGKVIAVIHRYNDIEDKWVVAPEGMHFSDRDIINMIMFQEKYFDIKLIRL